ncbi:hypothetical protein [Nocardia sienata]|uniref:hypothetical protein n=1 Tax=Nocardia sienata TaxID=248552 RepID=UPI0007A556E3|nr:hypothetical protein [Nocardia sienata]
MDYLQKAKDEVVTLVGRAMGSVSGGTGRRALTIERPRAAVEEFWRDPDNLSRVFDGFAHVRSTAPDRYEWTAAPDGADAIRWESVLLTEENGLQFVDAVDPERARVELEFTDAPRERGTEVHMSATAPLPRQLTGAAIFAVLYRARALMQTGEMPTLDRNPSGRTAPQEA